MRIGYPAQETNSEQLTRQLDTTELELELELEKEKNKHRGVCRFRPLGSVA